MPTMYLLCGLAFSGKTTLARALCRHRRIPCISLDDINEGRGLQGGDGVSAEDWEQTSGIAIERLVALMHRGTDVVVDDTSCFRWLRDRWRALAAANGYQTTLIYLDVELDEIQRRRRQNQIRRQRRDIRDDVFEPHAQTFEAPQSDEEYVAYTPELTVDEWLERNAG